MSTFEITNIESIKETGFPFNYFGWGIESSVLTIALLLMIILLPMIIGTILTFKIKKHELIPFVIGMIMTIFFLGMFWYAEISVLSQINEFKNQILERINTSNNIQELQELSEKFPMFNDKISQRITIISGGINEN